jgi:hypothetical protein
VEQCHCGATRTIGRKKKALSKVQANVLAALKDCAKATKRSQGFRVVTAQQADCYDWRTINSLIDRGLVRLSPGPHENIEGDMLRITDKGWETK